MSASASAGDYQVQPLAGDVAAALNCSPAVDDWVELSVEVGDPRAGR